MTFFFLYSLGLTGLLASILRKKRGIGEVLLFSVSLIGLIFLLIYKPIHP